MKRSHCLGSLLMLCCGGEGIKTFASNKDGEHFLLEKLSFEEVK